MSRGASWQVVASKLKMLVIDTTSSIFKYQDACVLVCLCVRVCVCMSACAHLLVYVTLILCKLSRSHLSLLAR